MEIKDAKRLVTLRQWSAMITECRSSGQTVSAWCEENGISIKTYYYRLKRVRIAALSTQDTEIQTLRSSGNAFPAFAALTLTDNRLTDPHTGDAVAPAVTIKAGSMTISIHNEAGAAVITSVIRAANEIT